MKTGLEKGLKPLFIKKMALLMGLCYLIGPLQHQFGTVLHELAHSLEMPANILSHQDSQNMHNYIQVYGQHAHENNKDAHEHPFIDLLDTVLESSNEGQESDKTPQTKIKLKKYIPSFEICLPKTFKIKVVNRYFIDLLKLRPGHINLPDMPPKNELS